MKPPLTPSPPLLQVIAMHGWSGVSQHWEPWRQAITALGWSWQSGERGYGGATPHQPDWQGHGRKVVIAHSLGPHLLPAGLLAQAEAVVLLASFGRFVPEGAAGRRLRQALALMDGQLGEAHDAQAMLRRFRQEAAAPDPVELLPPGPADLLLSDTCRERLRRDLALLGRSEGLPAGFPAAVPVLVVEAGQDRIVVPEARQLLRRDLEGITDALQWHTLEEAGHCLLRGPVLEPVLGWLQEQLLAP
ncbi:MAG: alpha/beta fold hydrolase [Cyanobium sp.]